MNVDEVYLPINSAIPCGLLINELITNALKHAFTDRSEGTISVALSAKDNKEIQLMISDDGNGIADHLNLDEVETLGLRLVNLLSQQLNGALHIQRQHPTQFVLRFPLTEH